MGAFLNSHWVLAYAQTDDHSLMAVVAKKSRMVVVVDLAVEVNHDSYLSQGHFADLKKVEPFHVAGTIVEEAFQMGPGAAVVQVDDLMKVEPFPVEVAFQNQEYLMAEKKSFAVVVNAPYSNFQVVAVAAVQANWVVILPDWVANGSHLMEEHLEDCVDFGYDLQQEGVPYLA